MTSPSTARASYSGALLVAVGCALLAGSVEVVTIEIRQHLLGEFAFASPDSAWLAPAATLLLVVPPTLLVTLAARLIRRPLSLATILAVLVGVLGFGALLPYGWLAWWASAMVATGVAVQVARLAARVRDGLIVRTAAYVSVGLAVGLAVTASTAWVSRAQAERSAFRQLPTPRPGAPNVLVIVLDTVRSASLGLYGYDRPTTPQLERWAASSTVFDQAISPAPWTLPSHASMFTGRASHTLSTGWLTPLDGTARTVAEAFRDRGYATGGFVANLTYLSYESGLNRGFVHFEDYPLSVPILLFHTPLGRLDIKAHPPASAAPRALWRAARSVNVSHHRLVEAGTFRRADNVMEAFQRWRASVGARPFFAFINLFDAHGPYKAEGPSPLPAEFVRRFSGTRASERDRYDAAIAWLDDAVGRELDTLQEQGLLDNTIVIITSDHGEQFDERGLLGHGNSLYPPAVHVPLIVRAPGRAPVGIHVPTTVSLTDLAATLLDLAEIRDACIPGTSLAEAWRTPGAPVLGRVVSELKKAPDDPGELVSRFDGRYQYIADDKGREELYDLQADSHEPADLATHADMLTVLNALRQGLTYPWKRTVDR